MAILKPLNRRKFLAQSAALAAASTLPLPSFAQSPMGMREIPGTGEYLPLVGMGTPDIFISIPPEGIELPISVIQTMLDHGGKMVDTPAFYRPDTPAFGEIIKTMGVKDDLFLISKITVAGKEAGINHVERVLHDLDKDPLDLLLVHNMNDMDNNWPTVKDYKAQGKVRYTGISLTRQTDYTRLEDFMKAERPDFIMTGYSITQQGPGERVLPLAMDLGIAVIAVEPFKAIDDGAFFSMVAGIPVPEWAAEFDCTSWAQFSLKWILSNPAMTSVVTETRQPRHVIDNMHGGYGRMPDEATRKRMADFLLALA